MYMNDITYLRVATEQMLQVVCLFTFLHETMQSTYKCTSMLADIADFEFMYVVATKQLSLTLIAMCNWNFIGNHLLRFCMYMIQYFNRGIDKIHWYLLKYIVIEYNTVYMVCKVLSSFHMQYSVHILISFTVNKSLNKLFKHHPKLCHHVHAVPTVVKFATNIRMAVLLFLFFRDEHIFAARNQYMPHPNTFTKCWNCMHYCMLQQEKSMCTHFVRKEKVGYCMIVQNKILPLQNFYIRKCTQTF